MLRTILGPRTGTTRIITRAHKPFLNMAVSSVLLFLVSFSSKSHVDAFVKSAIPLPRTTAPHNLLVVSSKGGTPPRAFKTYFMAKSRTMPDIEEKDDDGNVVRIPVKNIERDWTWYDETYGEYDAEGEFSVDLFLPLNNNNGKKEIKGCAFFMHGFSQYPIAYRETLKEAAESSKVAIIAVETGITSEIVLNDVLNKPKGAGSDWAQFVLQRAVSEDTKQCIKMVLAGDDVFEEYGITKRAVENRIAVMGHSMGGGLSFPVAAALGKEIDYVFTMAPAYGVKEFFDPIDAVESRTASNSMLLAGSWDIIARAGKVEAIAEASNEKCQDSSIYVDIKRGLHTGFQDRVVLFSIPLFAGLGFLGFLWNIFGLADVLIFQVLQAFLAILSLNKKKTGQLIGTRMLMEYFLGSVAERKKTTLEDAKVYLDYRLDDSIENNFDFSYPKKKK